MLVKVTKASSLQLLAFTGTINPSNFLGVAMHPFISSLSSANRADAPNDSAADQDPVLTNLNERQRKRAIEKQAEREGEEQRPLSKPKAAQRRNKRTAGTT